MNFLGKYVISPLDGKEYCRKNGQFLRHLISCGYSSYTDFYEKCFPDKVEYCQCGNKKIFNERKMRYKPTCGKKECANKIISKRRQERTPEEWEAWKEKYKNVMSRKTEDEKARMIEKRIETGKKNNSYINSVGKREETCQRKYGNKKYNNSQQTSKTKLEWTEDRKNAFVQNLRHALNGKWLSDFQTEETYKARREKLEEAGRIIPMSELTEWNRYKKIVRNLTEQTYRKHKDIINPNNLKRGVAKKGTDHYHLDHIVPIFYGFVHGISETTMASVENLQMLSWYDNVSKGKKV